MDLNEIRECERSVLESPNPYAAVAAYAVKIDSLAGLERSALTARFESLVKDRGLEDTPSVQAKYAMRLLAEDHLLFEEVAKVFYLLEELHALDNLGFSLPGQLSSSVNESYTAWLEKNREQARTIAYALVGDHPDSEKWFHQKALGRVIVWGRPSA